MSLPPLQVSTVATVLHYITPTIQQFPEHLIASQLAFRHTCLNLTPDDPAYLSWPSSDDDRVKAALESFQRKPIDDTPLDLRIRYTADDAFFAHAEITPELRLVFQWEGDTWKYHNAAPMPFPRNSSASIDAVPPQLPADVGDDEDTPGSYWDSYGDSAASDHEPEGVEMQQEPSDSYWDLYNQVQGSGDSAIPSPAPEKQRHDVHTIEFSYTDMHPTADPIETLSDRLEALAQRPRTPEEEEEDTVTVVNGTGDEDGLKAAVRGVWELWRSTRAEARLGDRAVFLRVVHDVVGES